jgi:hypothetical protein
MPQENAQDRQTGLPAFASDLAASSPEYGAVLGLTKPPGRQLGREVQVLRPIFLAESVEADPQLPGVMSAAVPLAGIEMSRLHRFTLKQQPNKP